MKKFLLSLAAVIGLGAMAYADTYTYTASEIMGNPGANKNFNELTNSTTYVGGFAFSAVKNDGTTEPTYNFNNKDLRIYAKNTLNVKANGAKITSISFEISTQGLRRFPDVTPNVGAIAQQAVNPLVWNGNAADVAFTVGEKAVHGTDGADKAGQFDFASVTITTDGPVTKYEGTETPVTPEPQGNSAIYEQATAMAAGSYVIYAEETVAVPMEETKNYGYIQVSPVVVDNKQITTDKANAFEFVAVEGGYNIKDSFGRYVYQTGTYNNFNVSAEINADVEASCYVWAVEVKDGKFIVKNTNVEKTLQYDTQYGSFGSYPDERGIYPVLYKYVKDTEGGQTPEAQRTSVTSLNQLSKLANNELIKMDVDLNIIFCNGSYNYVCEGNNYGLIYKKDLGLEAGKVIAKGWTGKVSIYNNLIELVPDDATLSTFGECTAAPQDIQADEAEGAIVAANQNAYVCLLGVEFAEATPAADAGKDEAGNDLRNFTGKFGDIEIAFYQRFGVESVPAGTYDVVGFISVYKENVQVYPVSFKATSSIASLESNEAEAVYYNIQGMKVAQPREGSLYIRIQNGNASKIVF